MSIWRPVVVLMVVRRQRPAALLEDIHGHGQPVVAKNLQQQAAKIMPGAPYVTGLMGIMEPQRPEGSWWKLDECLR